MRKTPTSKFSRSVFFLLYSLGIFCLNRLCMNYYCRVLFWRYGNKMWKTAKKRVNISSLTSRTFSSIVPIWMNLLLVPPSRVQGHGRKGCVLVATWLTLGFCLGMCSHGPSIYRCCIRMFLLRKKIVCLWSPNANC